MAEEHEIRVLEAEWAYLTRPETLDAMNRRFLSLAPISTKQLHTTVADIPMRPPPPGATAARRSNRLRSSRLPSQAACAERVASALEEAPPQAPDGADAGQAARRAAADAKRTARHAGLVGETGGRASARQGGAGQGSRQTRVHLAEPNPSTT